MRQDYPVGTMIDCVIVGGEGHGRLYARSPHDAYGFQMIKSPPLPRTFFTSEDAEINIDPPEIIDYEPFTEINVRRRNKFIRLFSVNGEPKSVLQIADALRIAGIHEL